MLQLSLTMVSDIQRRVTVQYQHQVSLHFFPDVLYMCVSNESTELKLDKTQLRDILYIILRPFNFYVHPDSCAIFFASNKNKLKVASGMVYC